MRLRFHINSASWLVVGAAALWALIPVCAEAVVSGGGISPYALATWRFLLGAAALCLAQWCRGQRVAIGPALRSPWCLAAGVCLGLDFMCLHLGLRYTTATMAALLTNTYLPVMALCGWLWLGEHFSWKGGLAVALTLVGLCLPAFHGSTGVNAAGSSALLGNCLVAAAGAIWAGYSVANKHLLKKADPVNGLIAILLVGAVATLPLTLTAGGWRVHLTIGGWALVLLLGFACTGLSYFLFASGISRISLSAAGIICALTPAESVFLAFLLLHEPVRRWDILGGFLITLGIMLSALAPRPAESH